MGELEVKEVDGELEVKEVDGGVSEGSGWGSWR